METHNELIRGLVTATFLDIGPQVIFNSLDEELSEDESLNLAIRVMTVIGEELTEEIIYGPFPVPGHEELLCITFAFTVKSIDSSDPRLGLRPTIICILFNKSAKRELSQVMGYITTFLQATTKKEFEFDSDLKKEKMVEIHRKLTSIVSTKPFKVYRLDKEKSTECLDPILNLFDSYMIIDSQKNSYFIIFGDSLSALKKREMIISAGTINEKFHRRRLARRIIDNQDEILGFLSQSGLKRM